MFEEKPINDSNFVYASHNRSMWTVCIFNIISHHYESCESEITYTDRTIRSIRKMVELKSIKCQFVEELVCAWCTGVGGTNAIAFIFILLDSPLHT